MKELIIFGRSPFINELNLENIDYNRFDVCCINYPIKNIKVHYVVSADDWVMPKLAPKTEWISQNTGYNFVKTDEIVQDDKKLSWRLYSSSLAVNFGISKGYKRIYLGGIDLIEDDKPFSHYDGVINQKPASANSMVKEKAYIKKLAQVYNVELFQLNKNAGWLEFKDIGLL